MSLQHAILGLLTYSPMTGYDLKAVFDRSVNHFWPAQLSQIYRDLGDLEKRGLVSRHTEPQKGRPDRKVYNITEEGRRAFDRWLARFPRTLGAVARDEFSVHIFFGSRLSSGELEFQLKRYIRERQEEIASYSALDKIMDDYAGEISRPKEKFFWRMTLKRGYIMAEASIRWAEKCLQDLEIWKEVTR